MKCSEINEMLDKLLDNDLTDKQLRELYAHGETCPACAENIRAAFQLKDMFAQMVEEVDVPLTAQAAWRKAVKAESVRKKLTHFYRIAGSVAAVAVLTVGIGWGLNEKGIHTEKQPDVITIQTENDTTGARTAIIQADGEQNNSDVRKIPETRFADTSSAPMYEWHMVVENPETACNHISDLVEEYEGTAEIQNLEENGKTVKNLYVIMPSENIDDFMNSAGYLDLSGAVAVKPEVTGVETFSLLLVLSA